MLDRLVLNKLTSKGKKFYFLIQLCLDVIWYLYLTYPYGFVPVRSIQTALFIGIFVSMGISAAYCLKKYNIKNEEQ